jgi:hypothetical protein
VLAILVGLVVLSWQRHLVDRQLQARLDELRATGQPVSLSELRKWSPPVPANENAALLWENAAPLLVFANRLPRTPAGPRRVEWPGPAASLTPEFRTALSNLVARNQPALELLHASARLSTGRVSINWSYLPPRMAHWQAFGTIAPAAQILQFEGLHRLEAGNVTGAVASVETLIGMARATGQEPFLSAQHYRAHYLRTALWTLERVLHQHTLADPALEKLHRSLQEVETNTGAVLARAFIGERALELNDVFNPPALPPGWGTPTASQKFVLAVQSYTSERLGVPQRAVLQHLDGFAQVIVAASQIGARDFTSAGLHPNAGNQAGVGGPQRLVPGWEAWQPILIQQVELVAHLRVARAALAIERFRALHGGQLPQELGMLVPWFIDAVPSDPFLAGPLRYKRLGDEYVVYSVGADQEDESGAGRSRSNRNWPPTGDVSFRVAGPGRLELP